MRFESARDLKHQLLSEVIIPLNHAAIAQCGDPAQAETTSGPGRMVHSSGRAIAPAAMKAVSGVQPTVALGIARDGREFRLAVRVQREKLAASRLVEQIVERARGEADVRLIGRVEKRGTPWYRGNVRPLLIGASVGHAAGVCGSIGAFVSRGGRVCILSNNHVLANEDRGRKGDAVLQRGALDGGCEPRDSVAALRHAIRLKKTGVNWVDAALAEIGSGVAFDPGLLRGIAGGADRKLAGLGPEFLEAGETVHKIGRTTGVREGRVTAFDLDNLVVGFDIGNLRFDGQVEVEGAGAQAFSDRGDSGSLIVDAGMRAVALLFAGSQGGGTNGLGLTYANPIHKVLESLQAELLT